MRSVLRPVPVAAEERGFARPLTERDVLHLDVLEAADAIAENPRAKRVRLEGVDPARRPDDPGKELRVEADVGAHVEDGHAGSKSLSQQLELAPFGVALSGEIHARVGASANRRAPDGTPHHDPRDETSDLLLDRAMGNGH